MPGNRGSNLNLNLIHRRFYYTYEEFPLFVRGLKEGIVSWKINIIVDEGSQNLADWYFKMEKILKVADNSEVGSERVLYSQVGLMFTTLEISPKSCNT